jgi:hypothetical protein
MILSRETVVTAVLLQSGPKSWCTGRSRRGLPLFKLPSSHTLPSLLQTCVETAYNVFCKREGVEAEALYLHRREVGRKLWSAHVPTVLRELLESDAKTLASGGKAHCNRFNDVMPAQCLLASKDLIKTELPCTGLVYARPIATALRGWVLLLPSYNPSILGRLERFDQK